MHFKATVHPLCYTRAVKEAVGWYRLYWRLDLQNQRLLVPLSSIFWTKHPYWHEGRTAKGLQPNCWWLNWRDIPPENENCFLKARAVKDVLVGGVQAILLYILLTFKWNYVPKVVTMPENNRNVQETSQRHLIDRSGRSVGDIWFVVATNAAFFHCNKALCV